VRETLTMVVLGAGLSLGFYGVLRAADPSIDVNNPWLLHFRESGLNAHLRYTTTNVNRRIAPLDWRGELAGPDCAGARLASMMVEYYPVQVVEFPSAEAAGRIEGLKRDKRLRIAREGRWMCIVSPVQGQIPKAAYEKIFRAFRARAEKTP
jgi:hypothetical protein